jgi:KAP family P-loop domain
MEEQKQFKFETTEMVVKFNDFLNELNNDRIIFSGKFGSGKTQFLKENFINNANVIHLFPVNYSIASNDDIFDLIKYDILFELVNPSKNRDMDLMTNDFSLSLNLQTWLFNKGDKPFKPLISKLSSVGKNIYEYIDIIEALKKDFNDFANYSEEKKIDTFLKQLKKESKILEADSITVLIKKCIQTIKDKSTNQDTILIIDDLDRIDPEHVFRILNVFSAHIDLHSNENKFGFDKIIFVCDYDNLKSIFHHRFGLNTDFNGYMNKFYSKQIFEFNLSKEFINEFANYLDSANKNLNAYFEHDGTNFLESSTCKMLYYILNVGFANKLIDLRGLMRKDVTIVKYKINYSNNRAINKCDAPYFFDVLFILRNILGGELELKSFFQKFEVCTTFKYLPILSEKIILNLLTICSYQSMPDTLYNPFVFVRKGQEYRIRYDDLVNNKNAKIYYVHHADNRVENEVSIKTFIENLNINELFFDAYKKLANLYTI